MLNWRQRFWFYTAFVLFFFSCSTTKKGIFNREYHALTTKFNVLFNAKEAFEVGQAILEEAFEDNFFELLPVEPINLRGEDIDEPTLIPGFNRAEEKSVKAIQKHSINLNNEQYNRKIDDAYLLLGKARYFDRRFFPALEAFNFLLKSGADQEVFAEGKIWREKTNIRLRNVELAIDNLRPLARALNAKNKNYPLANATLAQAFTNLKALDSAVFYIKRAALEEPKRKNKSRYLYITGQLFEQLGKRDSAQWAYKQIVALKRKGPRKFLVHAQIKENELDTSITLEKRRDFLIKMRNNYENSDYRHTFERALAKLYLKKHQDSLALLYFNLSLESPSLDTFTQTQNYQDLADYYFDQGSYLESGNYLDKILPLYNPKSKVYQKIQSKRDNLEEVISYEHTRIQTDSLLRLLTMTKDQQLAFFEDFINQKQEKERIKAQQEIEEKRFQLLGRSKTMFYFYNKNQLLVGKQAYLANWGNRPNVDNWRNVSTILTLSEGTTSKENILTKASIIQETPKHFIASLPKTDKEKDSLTLLNQKANLQLGMIYKEKFNNLTIAEERLEKVLLMSPPKEIAVQALYHLYRINEKTTPSKAHILKETIIDNYPETPFAQILLNPDNLEQVALYTTEKQYEKALKLFQQQQFQEALKELEQLTVLLSGTQIEPKISLLKANVLGRLNGVSAWKEALKQVAKDYSAVKEGIEANQILERITSSNNLKETGRIYKNYKWIFPFKNEEKENASLFFKKLKIDLEGNSDLWTVSMDTYSKDYFFVVVHGITDPKEIEIWKEKKRQTGDGINKIENFVTLSAQYRDLIKNKTWLNKSK